MVPTRLCQILYRPRNNSITVRVTSWSYNFLFYCSQLVAQIIRSNAFELSSIKILQSKVHVNKLRPLTSWRRKLIIVWTIFNHINAKRSWKTSTNDCVCARKGVDTIHPVCYSIRNPLLFTLGIKKNTISIKNLLYFSKLLLARILGHCSLLIRVRQEWVHFSIYFSLSPHSFLLILSHSSGGRKHRQNRDKEKVTIM